MDMRSVLHRRRDAIFEKKTPGKYAHRVYLEAIRAVEVTAQPPSTCRAVRKPARNADFLPYIVH
jgi:hypothetical protein